MATTLLPPPPINDQPGSFAWLEWYRQLRNYVSTSGSVPWYIINFQGSNITDIATRLHNQLQGIQGGASGELYHLNNSDYANLTGGSPSFTNEYLDFQIFNKAQGYGIKVDTTTPTYPWQDLIGPVAIRGAGANDPTFELYRGNIREFQFATDNMNEIFHSYHITHDYVPNSDMFIHVHWSTIGVDTGGPAGVPGNAKFYFDISYSKGHNQASFNVPVTTSVVQQAGTSGYRHMIAEVQFTSAGGSGSTLDSALLEPDGLILVRTYRDPADAADTLNLGPFVHFIDIHYQSTGIGTKQKAPNFYV